MAARISIGIATLTPVIRHYGGFHMPKLGVFAADIRPILAIAFPAILTQLASTCVSTATPNLPTLRTFLQFLCHIDVLVTGQNQSQFYNGVKLKVRQLILRHLYQARIEEPKVQFLMQNGLYPFSKQPGCAIPEDLEVYKLVIRYFSGVQMCPVCSLSMQISSEYLSGPMAEKDKLTLSEWQSVQLCLTDMKVSCLNGHSFDIDMQRLEIIEN